MSSTKPFLTLEQQVELLKSRGLIVRDEDELALFLHKTSYYRLSGYAREFQMDPRNKINDFEAGTTSDEIRSLMCLDQRLRRLILEALEKIEVTSRSAFSYAAGQHFGSKAFYLDANNYLPSTPDLDKHITKIETQLNRSGQPFVDRYRNENDLSGVPIWVATEAMSFGTFAKLCQYLKEDSVVKQTAAALSIQNTGFSSTIHKFSDLRNRCAHYGQL